MKHVFILICFSVFVLHLALLKQLYMMCLITLMWQRHMSCYILSVEVSQNMYCNAGIFQEINVGNFECSAIRMALLVI